MFMNSGGNVGIGTTAPSARLTVNGDLTFTAAPTTIRADGGRLHITGGEILYLLNKNGVTIGKEWGGTGSLTVEGDLTTGGASTFAGDVGLGGFGGGDRYLAVRAAGGNQNRVGLKLWTWQENFGFSLQFDERGAGPDGLHVKFHNVNADGTTLMFMNSGGNVGIGTTSPRARLEVAGGGGSSIDLLVNGRLQSNNNDGGLWVASDRFVGGFDTNKIGFFNGSAWRVAVLNNGYVGIGTTTPSAMLTVNGDLTFTAAPTTIRADGGRLHITGGEILYLLNKNGVTIGKEWGGTGSLTVEGDLNTSGTTWLHGDTFVSGRFVMQINATTWWGIGPKQSSALDPTQWAAYYGTSGPSDVRLKADLRPITHALGMVRKLQGVRYRWGDSGLKYFTQGIDENLSAGPNATEDQSDRIRESERRKAFDALSGDFLGLVAQDVEPVIPELVHEDGAGYKQIRYQHLTALLVEAIKEQDAMVRALSAQVAALSTGQLDGDVRQGGDTEHA